MLLILNSLLESCVCKFSKMVFAWFGLKFTTHEMTKNRSSKYHTFFEGEKVEEGTKEISSEKWFYHHIKGINSESLKKKENPT